MAIRRVLLGTATAAFAAALATATATPSQAQPTYPPAGPAVLVSSTVVTVGETITVDGSGFLPNSTVTISSFVGTGTTAQSSFTGGGTAVTRELPQARVETAALTDGDSAQGDSAQGETTQGGSTDGEATQGGSTDGRFGHGHHHRCSTGRTCRVRVDAEGDFSTPYTLTRRGLTAIRVRGQDAEGARADVTVTVRVRRGSWWGGHGHHHGAVGSGLNNTGNSGLAMTGTPVAGGLAAGTVMLLAGSGLLVGLRRRRRRVYT